MAKTTLEDLAKVFKTKEPKKDFHYYGQVVSVDRENRTYEVSINRDESITVEAARLVGAGVGDTVMVTVMANGYATVTGRVGGDMDASDAQRTADNASDAASSALSQARSAAGTASQAQNKAVEALGIANNAVELAEQAEEEAGRASTAATQAAASASSAEADASRAATSAQNAEADASSASTSAQNAAASASSASTSASNAATSAQNAASDAASAATSASNAEADASSAATSAQSASASAQNASASAQSAASDASSASSSATAAAADAATARQQSSAATTAANEAKTQAQAANTAANEAKADASSAKRDAAAANTAANGAVAGLAVVQGVVDQLETDVDDMQTHVAMMNAIDDGDVHIPAGLHVVPSASGYFMVIANDGVYVYDNESVLVAKYGHNIIYDTNREHKIGNNTSYIRYYDSNNDGVADAIEIVADNIRLGSYSVGDKITATETTLNNYMSSNNTRVGNVETSVTTTTTNLTNYITSNNQAIESLERQIDGAIDTWYYSGVPTLNNDPAQNWPSNTYESHERDLYFDTSTGHTYRFARIGNTEPYTYEWIEIQDADALRALQAAAAAQDTADNKRRVFVTRPAPPYEIGDLWVQGQNGDIFRCATPKTSQQSYDAADWVKASKYTDDTKANAVESDLHTNYYVKSDFSVAPDQIASTISATETTVKTYADGKASAAESNAKTYADGKASTAETNAKTYADNNFDSKGSAASALDDAKDYADDNFDSKGSASAAQAAAISAAAADATSKANAAESNAKADTANKLTSYYTKTQTDSAITQSANSILSTVSTTYQTKDDMDDYSTTAEMNSAINQKADSITSTVAQTYATKTQAQGYADTAESNAKTAAATDATSKANAAKQAAIDDAASKYYTKTQTYTKSEIEQKAGEISLSVAQEEVEKIEIGGRNLLKFTKAPTVTGDYNTGWRTWSGTPTNTPEGIKITNDAPGVASFRIPLVYQNAVVGGEEVTLSFEYRTNFSSTTATIYLICNTGGNKVTYIKLPSLSETEWNKYSGTISFSSTEGQVTESILIPYNPGWFEIKNGTLKLEKGNKATAWTPAPEDLEKYTDNAKEEAIADAATKYYTKTETVSEITQRAEEISLQVTGNKISQITYDEDNLLINADDLTKWTTENGISVEWDDEVGMYKITDRTHTSSRWGLFQDLDCSPNTYYTFSMDGMYIEGDGASMLAIDSYETTASWPGEKKAFSTERSRKTYTWKTGASHSKIRVYICHNATRAGSYFYAVRPKLSINATENAKAEIKVTTDAIESTVSTKVGNDEIISKIRQSAETVKIQANRVEIDGTATFNAIKSQTDAAYDAKNSAATAESNAKTYADGKASTAESNAKTYADGKASTAETNAKTYADGLADDLEEAIPTKVSDLTNDSGFQNGTQVSDAVSNGIAGASVTDLSDGSSYSTTSDMNTAIGNATGTKADKTAALSRSQRIYYRSTSIQNLDSFSGPTTWLSTSGTGYENWSLSIPQLTNGEDSYPYLYTCVQNQTAAQYAAGSVCTCTPVVRDDSTTVIDGGSITTGQILARYIETNGLYINSTQVNDLDDLLDAKQNAGDYITDSDFDERISDIAAAVDTLNGQILFGDDGTNTFILLQNHVKNNPESVTGVQAKLTSGKLAFGTFGSSDNEVAYFSSEELRVQKRLSFGNFVMKQRDNGHLSIMFEGGDD